MLTARELIANGDFEKGLAKFWLEIDSGSDAARVELANLFTNSELHAFAQDQWLFLIQNSPDFSGVAKQGIGANRLWLRDYEGAFSAIDGVSGAEGLQQAISSGQSDDPLLDPVDLSQFAGRVLLDEATFLADLEQEFCIETQRSLIQARDVIANISMTISYPGNKSLQALQFEYFLGNEAGVPRRLGDHFGEPKDALIRAAHACGLMIHSLSTDETNLESETFKSACKIGLASFEKIFLLSGEIYSPNDRVEAQAFEAITWGLQQLGLFSGFIYGGLLEN